jgi:flagellar M-ring protein FliF
MKQVAGALFILAMIFGVLRPMLKTLANNKGGAGGGGLEYIDETEPGELTYDGSLTVKDANDYESQLNLLRQVVDKEPKRVAQVVKTWVDRG